MVGLTMSPPGEMSNISRWALLRCSAININFRIERLFFLIKYSNIRNSLHFISKTKGKIKERRGQTETNNEKEKDAAINLYLECLNLKKY